MPAALDVGNWNALAPLFADLASRQLESAESLEEWVRDEDELMSCLWEENYRRIAATQADSSDVAAAGRLREMKAEVWAHATPIVRRLALKYLECPYRRELPETTYGSYGRLRQAQANFLSDGHQQFLRTDGALASEWAALDEAVAEQDQALLSPDRKTREQAWRGRAQILTAQSSARHELLSRTVRLRNDTARRSGYVDYPSYHFAHGTWINDKSFKDTTVQQCLDLHETIALHVMPLVRLLDEQRRRELGVQTLRPWDLAAPGPPEPEPFASADDLISATGRVLRETDTSLFNLFTSMNERGLIDLGNQPTRAKTIQCSYLAELRLSHIFIKCDRRLRWMASLLHEFGHAYHESLLDDMLYPQRADLPFEFSEFASEAMNFLTLEHLRHGLGAELARALTRHNLRLYLNWMADFAAYDSFQLWLYLHPEHSIDERRQAMRDAQVRFGHKVDWSGLSFDQQLLLLESPFDWTGDLGYMIPLVACFAFWGVARSDPQGAMRRYKHALSLGATAPTRQLFSLLGLPESFGPEALAPAFTDFRRVYGELLEVGPDAVRA